MQISFMPWADLHQELQLGPVTFWPFYEAADKKIQDSTVREHLKRYFQCYVDNTGRPAQTIVVCSHKAIDFRELNQREASELRMAVDALLFSIISDATENSVCSNNRTMGPPSADRYELITQDFQPGNDDISVRAGTVLSGGWKIGEISFPMPWCMGGSFGSPDQKLIQGFSKTFRKGFASNVRNRLFRSLEWFRHAHTESDVVSAFSKIVMMATAFEIILNVPNTPNKSEWIANEMDRRCSNPKSSKQTRKDKKGNDVTRAKIGWWAWEFYKLRNAVVHGDQVRAKLLQYRAWLTQLIVADLVFWECVTRELYNHRCIGTNARACSADWSKVFPNEPKESMDAAIASWLLGYDRVHQSLGWLSKR